jgi:hypothetical protein
MDRGARYTVKTRYGVFSLDEGSYRDYLAGKLWINWPPERDPNHPLKQEPLPPDVSQEAIQLRESTIKHGVLQVLQQFIMMPSAPYKDRMHDVSIYELNLSVRASNGLMRAGIQTFGKLSELLDTERGIMSIRNLGAKSVKEIQEAFMVECYDRLLNYEKAAFWQDVLGLNEEVTA